LGRVKVRLPRRIALGLLAVGLLACLRTFGPDLRPRGAHDLPVASPNAVCMGCHESEAEALARLHAGARVEPMQGSDAPPLVAEWMVDDPHPCTHCHRIRQ
jgi:predicted lysophospholipase L1 biosynthesis ABC-type transport system permease subunit